MVGQSMRQNEEIDHRMNQIRCAQPAPTTVHGSFFMTNISLSSTSRTNMDGFLRTPGKGRGERGWGKYSVTIRMHKSTLLLNRPGDFLYAVVCHIHLRMTKKFRVPALTILICGNIVGFSLPFCPLKTQQRETVKDSTVTATHVDRTLTTVGNWTSV